MRSCHTQQGTPVDCAQSCLPGLHVHTYIFTLSIWAQYKKTISLPEQIAKRLDKEAKRRKTSVSAIVTELVQQRQPARLPYAGLIDDDEQMSQNIEQILARLGS